MPRTLSLLFIILLGLVLPRPALAEGERPCGSQQLRALLPRPVEPWTGARKGNGQMPTVGEQRGLWTYDLSVMPPRNVQIASTCRAVGNEVAIWVADDQWGSTVSQTDIDRIVQALEHSTPALPESGIMANNAELFGELPAVTQGDPRLTLFIYEIAGYGSYSFDGFFRREDMTTYNDACRTNPSLYCSNELAMIHVNSDNVGSDYMIGVIAHEATHLALFGADANEEIWLEETMAELAMAHSGYDDPGNVRAFADRPNQSLVSDAPVSYGACFLFGLYLFERLGADAIRAIVADSANGLASVSTALPEGFALFLSDWAGANALDDASVGDGRFDYLAYDPPAFNIGAFGSALTKSINVAPSAAVMQQAEWSVGDSHTLAIQYQSASAELRVLIASPTTGQIERLEPGIERELPAAMVQQAWLIIASNADPDSAATVSFEARFVELPVADPYDGEIDGGEIETDSDVTEVAEEQPEPADDVFVPDAEAFEPSSESVEVGPETPADGDDGGCGCTLRGRAAPSWSAGVFVLLAAAALRRRQRR